jgi:hypothetical protein
LSFRASLCFGLLLAAICLLLSSPLPVLDEESYLWIAGRMDPLRPYDWPMPWPPWDDAFVYAHPPLFLWWVKLGMQTGLEPHGLKILLGLPWLLLLGISMARLSSTAAKRPLNGAMIWLASPLVLMGLSRPLMPDLQVCALGTASMWLYLSGEKRDSTTRLLLSGLCLGLAAWTKYPALLLWIPVLLHVSRWRRLIPLAAGFCAVWVAGELWLYSVYGRPHLLEVLRRAPEIGRGSIGGRSLGILMRMAIAAPFLLALLRPRRASLAAGAAGAMLAWVFAPGDLGAPLLLAACIWAALCSSSLMELLRPGGFLSAWTLVVLAGVAVAHNFSAPRYMLLAAAPMALAVGDRLTRRGAALMAAFSLCLSLCLVHAERGYAASADSVARQISASASSPGFYTGEWTFRWRMEAAGWSFGRDSAARTNPASRPFAAAVNAGPGVSPAEAPKLRVSAGGPGLRLLDARSSVGWYSETLGFWPLGWSDAPLEEGWLW